MKACKRCGEDKELGEYRKDKRNKSGLGAICKQCDNALCAAYRKANIDKVNANGRKHSGSQGYSVYMAVYPSGIYIGSGQTVKRRNNHTSGYTTIAKSLKEKATSFEVLMKGSKEKCIQEESKLIDLIGLDKLLNTKR